MNTLARVSTFGFVSGLFWSALPDFLGGSFGRPVDLLANAIAGVAAGIITSAVLASALAKSGRARTVVFGLLSLPLGVAVFALALAFIDRFFPDLTNGACVLGESWIFRSGCGLPPFFAAFAAVFTTLLLRAFVVRGSAPQAP